MDKQIILACDSKGKLLRYIPKEEGHLGKGIKHLAIAVLLFNSKGKVLLQKRKHQVFDNVWDLTGATHPLHLLNRDETFIEATLRCLKREYGINISEACDLTVLGGFEYFAKDGKNCENEFCVFLIGKYDGEIKLNKAVGYEYKWMDKNKFLKDIKTNPQSYSAWAREAIKLFHGDLTIKRD